MENGRNQGDSVQLGESWKPLERGLTPRSPTDWRRHIVLTVVFVAVYLAGTLVISLLTGARLTLPGAQYGAIFSYFFIGALWWRSYFQEVREHADGGEDDRRLRRLLVRGAAFWIVLAYVVVFVLLIWYSAEEPSGSGDEENATGLLLVIFLLLPLGLAVFTAFLGRMWLIARPSQR